MITTRDIEIISFVEKFKIASTTTLYELFFPTSSLRYCQKRLTDLVNDGELKRQRKSVLNEYAYYRNKKPKQFIHSLLLSEFYRNIHKHINIVDFEVEYTCEDFRADGFMKYIDKEDNKRISFVEVEISNNVLKEKLKKYEKFQKTGKYKEHFPIMPSLIIVTNKIIPKTELNIKKVNLEFNNLDEHF